VRSQKLKTFSKDLLLNGQKLDENHKNGQNSLKMAIRAVIFHKKVTFGLKWL
jgi:hypothetical protein